MSKFVLTAQLQLQAPTNTQQVINQIRGQLQGAINIPVNVQGSVQAAKQINQVNQAAQKATTAGERMGKAFGASIKRFAAFNIATRAVGLFASKLSQAVDESIKFQRELIKISQVTGKTTRELQGLTDTITNLSTTLGVSSTSLLQTGRILAQAGIKAGDLKVALEALAKTTLAPTFDNINETAEGSVAILAQFGEGVGALESQLGAINAVAGQFAVESGDLISVVRRTGGVFRQAGGDLNELIALFTSVRATTRENAESIATGLRTIFTRIQRPQTIEYLKQFGVQLTDLNGRFVGPYEAVEQLNAALAGLEQGDIRFVQIAEELGGFRQIGKVIPLIQNFEVAERARQAAIDGGNSLTKDAETAQQALSVQIEKTREKFLALIRSISETSTFQIMVKSLLGIANAFIKVAESIKPLLPLIAAFAAVKLSRGLGTFVSGIGAGLRGRNQGGKIHAFARGGTVPGTGNRDTVPAMLTPGEFVIRKSSVNKIGVDTLAAMNENGYAAGGVVTSDRHGYGGYTNNSKAMKTAKSKFLLSSGGSPDAWRNLTDNEKQKLAASEAAMLGAKVATSKGTEQRKNKIIQGANLDTKFGVSFLRGATSNISSTIREVRKESNATGRKVLDKAIINAVAIKNPDEKIGDIKKALRFVARGAVINTKGTPTFLQKRGSQIFEDEILNGIPRLFTQAASSFKGTELDPKEVAIGQLLSNSAIGSIEGQFFEAFVRRVTGNVLKDPSKDEIFDFPSLKSPDLNLLFGQQPFVLPNEFKNDASQKANISSAIGKALTLGKNPSFFASGGGVSGSDTVPAMLTPGEFVVNKKAAQSIGYGNLNRMNKQGVVGYANGGPVQYFANGSSSTGVQGAGVQGSGGQNTDTAGKLFALASAASLATSYLSDFADGAEASATFWGQFSTSLSTLINTSIALSFAFQALISDTIKQRLVSGFGNLSSKMGLTSVGFGSLLIGVTTVTMAVWSFYQSLIEAEKQNKEKAIKSGDAQAAAEAQEKIIRLQDRKFAGTAGALVGAGAIGYAGAQVGASWGAAAGTAVFPGVGTVVGAIGGAIVGGIAGYFAGDYLAQRLESSFTPLEQAAISGARAQAYASKAIQELGTAAEKVTPQLEDLKSGKVDLEGVGSVFSDFEGAARSLNQSVAAGRAERTSLGEARTQQLNRSAYQPRVRELVYGSIEDNVMEIDTKIEASKEEEKKLYEEFNKKTAEAHKVASEAAAAAGLTFDEYVSQIEQAAPELAAALKYNVAEFQKSEKEYENMRKAIEENRAALQAMTYGLGQFSGKAAAIANSISQTADRFGEQGFESALNTLSLAFTNAAMSMDPKDIQSSLNEFDSQLAAFGASVEDRAKFRKGAAGISFIQSRGENIFNRARAIQSQGRADANLAGPTGARAYIQATEQEIENSGLAPAIKEQLLLQLKSSEIQKGLEKALDSGDPQEISDALSGPLKESLEKSLQEFGESAARIQEQLRSAYQNQIQAQKDYTNTLRENIKVQQEAFGLIEEFGGAKFTNRQKVGLLNQDLSAISGTRITSGSAQELSKLSNAVLTSTQNIQRTQDANLRRTGVASFGQTTKQTVIDQAQLEQNQKVQQEIVDSARERIKLIREEIEIAKKKNALEKSAYEKLIGGDVLGFIEGQQANIAQDALLRGDVATAQQLGPQATLQALQNIQQFGTTQEQQLAGQTAGRASGLSPAQARQAGMVLADQTPEVQGLQSQAREFAQVMMQASEALTEMEKGELFITATTVNITERKAGKAAQAPMQTGATTVNFARGGVVYANRGIFVPRGTDTVPAMLTPGEFVVNRAAVQRGNNLAILQAMNNGQQASGPAMARGGTVRYYSNGGEANGGSMGISMEVANKMSSSLSEFAKAVDRLVGFEFKVKLDPTVVTVNLTGTSFLGKMKDDIKNELFAAIGNKMNNMSFNMAGEPNFNEGMS